MQEPQHVHVTPITVACVSEITVDQVRLENWVAWYEPRKCWELTQKEKYFPLQVSCTYLPCKFACDPCNVVVWQFTGRVFVAINLPEYTKSAVHVR